MPSTAWGEVCVSALEEQVKMQCDMLDAARR